MLQMKYDVDRNFSQLEDTEQLTLVSSRVQAQGRFLVGRMVDGELHLRPVHAMCRMRPSFQDIDDADRAREEVRPSPLFIPFIHSCICFFPFSGLL